MEYFYSILGEMNNKVEELIHKGNISKEYQIAIIGSDEYAFAIRTILIHKGYRVGCYIEDNDDRRDRVINATRAACSRYFNPTKDYIKIYSIDDWNKQSNNNWVFLYGSKDCEYNVEGMKTMNVKNIHCLLDWNELQKKENSSGKQKLTLDEIKRIEKKILFYFDNFCKENNLRYWLSGGSMLGTIRHKGFIPWDDDIDIFMPDTDYERFLQLFCETDLYKCQVVDDEYDVWGHYKFTRIIDKRTFFVENYPFYKHYLGINLEILPIVGLPEDKEERIAYIRQYDKYNKKRRQLFFESDGDIEQFRKSCEKYIPSIGDYKFDSSKYVGVLGTGYYERDCTTRSVYEKTIRLPFEDIEVNIPLGYKEYLDNLYGKGWEELPPEKDRIAKHDMEAYWIGKDEI